MVENAPCTPEPAMVDYVRKTVRGAFIKSLIALLLLRLPFVSPVSIFLASRAKKAITEISPFACQHNIHPGGLAVATNILSTIARIAGILHTIFWFLILFFPYTNY